MAPTKTVAGTVDDQGNITFGDPTEFAVARPTDGRPDTGRFTIQFTPPFITISAVVVTQVSKFAMGDTRDNAVVVNFAEGNADIITGRSDGKLENRSFSFIAIGT